MNAAQNIAAIKKYFTTLEQIGYISQSELLGILESIFMHEFFDIHRIVEELPDSLTQKINCILDNIFGKNCVFSGLQTDHVNSLSHYIIPDIPSYTINVVCTVNDSTMGSVTGDGTYFIGTNVTLTPTANTGYKFVKWSDNDTSNPRTFVATDNVTLEAIFAEE